ncbi:MAG: dihydropteroate synthase, partial [Promethearchaeota archaeon]
MNKIHAKLFESLEIGDDFPTVIMGVLNLSSESFYQGSVYSDAKSISNATTQMIGNGAKIIDIGGRSTAPWSVKITLDEEIKRVQSALEVVCN